MFLKLRIVFTILSAVCVAAIFPIGIFLDVIPAIVCAGTGVLFFLAMLFCKKKQEERENPPETQNKGDFFHPQPSENANAADERENKTDRS